MVVLSGPIEGTESTFSLVFPIHVSTLFNQEGFGQRNEQRRGAH